MKGRLKFSRNIKGIFNQNITTEGISSYLDGVDYQQKYNPLDETKLVKGITWPQRGEGSDPLCTAKGSHTGSGRRIAHLIVAMSFNKAIILFEGKSEQIKFVNLKDNT